MLGKWPNTYTFTKAIAEHVVVENIDCIPAVIFRPSISEAPSFFSDIEFN